MVVPECVVVTVMPPRGRGRVTGMNAMPPRGRGRVSITLRVMGVGGSTARVRGLHGATSARSALECLHRRSVPLAGSLGAEGGRECRAREHGGHVSLR